MLEQVRSWRKVVLWMLALLSPLALCVAYIVATRGTSFGSAVLDYASWAVMVCSSIPFIVVMPASRRQKLLLVIGSIPLNVALTFMVGVTLACGLYGSCL
jgi:FtsH-binding integral membrane protein